MAHKLIDQMLARCEIDKQDSDFTFLWALLLTAEAMAKTIVLGLVSTIENDTQRNRYRLEYELVRANGLGDWSKALEDLLTGPSSQFLINEAQSERKELTKNCKSEEWQHDSVVFLRRALDELGVEAESVGNRTDMKRWFRLLATLRNRTRAHGATKPAKIGDSPSLLFASIDTFYRNFCLFNRPWAYLYRNLSGKYRVTVVGEKSEKFDFLKKKTNLSLANGIYIYWDKPRFVPPNCQRS